MTTKAIKIKPAEEWRAEADLHTLIEAEKIKADPKRFERAQALAKCQMMEAAKVAAVEPKPAT